MSYTVTSIGDVAFYFCSGLERITIGEGIKTIRNNAFYLCYGLMTITIRENIETIGDNIFFCMQFTQVHILLWRNITNNWKKCYYRCSCIFCNDVGNISKPNIWKYNFHILIFLFIQSAKLITSFLKRIFFNVRLINKFMPFFLLWSFSMHFNDHID